MLTDPKYKGWYCGNKTRSLDYRTKKQVSPPREEWVMYRDPEIPAIVSKALWDRANAIFRARSARSRAHGQGGGVKYPYSGKIFCGLHWDSFHRQCLHTRQGGQRILALQALPEPWKGGLSPAGPPEPGTGRGAGGNVPSEVGPAGAGPS